MTKRYQTIVLEFEGDTVPLAGFGVEILGCEVVQIAMGKGLMSKIDDLLAGAEALLGEDHEKLDEITYDINKSHEDLEHVKSRLIAIIKAETSELNKRVIQ